VAVFLKKKGDVQVGAADTLGSMGAASKEAKTAIHEAGGADKLKELCSAASVASATVKKAAKRALADMGTAFLIHPIDSPSKLPSLLYSIEAPSSVYALSGKAGSWEVWTTPAVSSGGTAVVIAIWPWNLQAGPADRGQRQCHWLC
jgi:hypothetical protein